LHSKEVLGLHVLFIVILCLERFHCSVIIDCCLTLMYISTDDCINK